MARTADEIEARLAVPPAEGAFGDGELDGLDEPVRRYLRTAIDPGAPLVRAVRLRIRGHIKLGRWLPFRSSEVLAPHHGFLWRARVVHDFLVEGGITPDDPDSNLVENFPPPVRAASLSIVDFTDEHC